MAQVAVGDVYRLTMYARKQDQVAQWRSFWRCKAIGGLGASDGDLVQEHDTQFHTNLKNMMDGSSTYLGTIAQRVKPGGVIPAPQVTRTHAGAGTRGNPGPKGISGMVTLTTDFAGKRGKGRVFLPFPGSADFDAANFGEPSAGYFTSAGLFGALVVPYIAGAGADTSTMEPVLYNPLFIPDSLPITFFRASNKWHPSKRRGDTGRPNGDPL